MRQVAAFPYRFVEGSKGPIEVLLVTSSSGRWIIPKGDIDEGMAPHLAAEKEAFEEGGVRGRIGVSAIGQFRTRKDQDGAVIAVEVDVFPLRVSTLLDDWQEREWRKRHWFSRSAASDAVQEPELREIIRSFEPRAP
jgi:hypothetical protein